MSDAPSNATATPTEATQANSAGIIVQSLDERSAAAFGSAESAVGDESTPPEASAAVSADPEAAAKRAERRAALARLEQSERERVDVKAALRERDELRAKLREAEERSKQYERYVDPSKLTKEQFFALAHERPDLDPRELGEWIRERMANPDLAAAQAARKAVDPELAALRKQNEELLARVESFAQSQERAASERAEREAADQFFAFTKENAGASPFAARFLERHGPEEYVKLATRAAEMVPPHAGPQAVLDEIEEQLAALSGLYQAETASPQRRQAPPHTAPAAAQAPTHVSNTLAQQRSSVVNEDEEWARLPFEERSARVFG